MALTDADLNRMKVATRVEEARPCDSCGYDLRGLKIGDRCPECGSQILLRSAMTERYLIDAPRRYQVWLAIGLVLTGVGAIGRWVIPMQALMGMWGPPPPGATIRSGLQSVGIAWEIMVFAAVWGALHVCWSVGIWVVTRPRPAGAVLSARWSRHREWWMVRWYARSSVVMGLIGGACCIAMLRTGDTRWFAVWALVEGWNGAVSCWYLARVSDWEPDEKMAGSFRALAWAFGVFGVMLALLEGPQTILGWFVAFNTALWVGGMFVAGAAMMGFCLWSVVGVAWTISNARSQVARARRQTDAAAREAERLAALGAGAGTAASAQEEALLAQVLERADAPKHHGAEAQGEPLPFMPAPNEQVIPRAADGYPVERD